MSEDRRTETSLPTDRVSGDSPKDREDMTEIMKAHLDLIEGGASHYSKWSSVS